MDENTGAALIAGAGAVANLGAGFATNASNRKLAKQQNKWNLEYQRRAFEYNTEQQNWSYDRNLEQWHRQNTYNSPQAQMERLKSAGLNPNLVYGSGSGSAGTAATSPQHSPARYEAPRAERSTNVTPQIDAYQAVQVGQALALQKAQREQISAQTDAIRQGTKNSQVDELIKAAELTGRKLSNREKENLYELTIEQAKSNLRKTDEGIRLTQMQVNEAAARTHLTQYQRDMVVQQIEKLKQDYDIEAFKHKLNQLGISDRDGIWSRVAARALLGEDNSIPAVGRTFNQRGQEMIKKRFPNYKQ